MTRSPTIRPMNIEIISAMPEHEPVLANLLQLYIHDFSDLIDLELGKDGRFGYPHLSLYWTETGRHPFLVKANGHLAGFVFVTKGSQISEEKDVFDVTEFFVARGFRHRAIGMKAAHQIWERFPGKWEVRVIDRNENANKFWARAIGEFVGTAIDPTPFNKNGEGWHFFAFESKGTA